MYFLFYLLKILQSYTQSSYRECKYFLHLRTHFLTSSRPGWCLFCPDLLYSGTFIWRIEQFNLVEVPAQMKGKFYDGDAYIVLRVRNMAFLDDIR